MFYQGWCAQSWLQYPDNESILILGRIDEQICVHILDNYADIFFFHYIICWFFDYILIIILLIKTIVITLILIAATKNKNCLFLNINKMLDIFFRFSVKCTEVTIATTIVARGGGVLWIKCLQILDMASSGYNNRSVSYILNFFQ